MGQAVKVAVIGAGVAGLYTARELQREGHQVVVFERNHRLGGVWLYDPRTESDPIGIDPTREIIHSSLYPNMRTNLPRQVMCFTDYPFPRRETGDPRTFPVHEEVLWFLNKFAEDFELTELIRFNTEVVRVERVDKKKDKWVVESNTRGSDSLGQEVFQAVVICVGHCTEPRLAEVPGIEKWPGYQIHSHNYRVPEPFQGQVVVMIGLGPSSFDMSREIAKVAKEVHVATRNPDVRVLKLENHDNIWLHYMVERVHGDRLVAFKDGSSVYADVIFHCTGYKYHYPFLETNGIVTVVDNCVGPLYKHVFPPALAPWLSFIGIPQKAVIFQTVELQSKWVVCVLSGKVLLPDEKEMMTDVERYYQKMGDRGLPKRYTHHLYPNEAEYFDWLREQTGMPPFEEWRKQMVAECLINSRANYDKYRDEWNDSYWDGIIKAASVP
ncbi:Flavin-containing monooxygenase [Quillaja saponaria]|uniref:Flavin-containing monooxygenase n=1 Tax=Quillaja saponaria TaxID=32244 RepID=A0AAD7QIX7_QUISA|nr:Flavin-containing monooxygenase [Quillaja saponaria]